jgi:hypothetical protein
MLTSAPTGGCDRQAASFRVRVMSVICGKPARALPRPCPTVLRLRAAVGELRRIEVPALHGANQAEDRPIAKVLLPLQGDGKVEQECIAAGQGQRASRFEDGGEAGRR